MEENFITSEEVKDEMILPSIEEEAEADVEGFLNKHYDFRYNDVTGRIFYKEKAGQHFEEMTDYSVNSVLRMVLNQGFKYNRNNLTSLLISDFTPRYDQFHLYLNELPAWDQKTDYISQWADTITTYNQKLLQKCFKKWVVALVGSLKDVKTVNQTAPVFCGGQGIGKTRWISKLVPDELKAYFFSGTINMSNKDSITQLAECMLIDMDELENLSKSSIGDLKSLMTRENIRIRRPYGKVAEVLPRRASFIGSINDKDFLKDGTGSRRFLCFEVRSVDSNHTLDVNQLYAQALYLYETGFQFWFNAAEIAEVEANNEQFRKCTFEEELLMNHFMPCKADEATHFYSTTKLAQLLRDREHMSVSDSTVQRLGKALAGRKFIRLKKKGRYVWAVKDLKAQKVKYAIEAASVVVDAG